MELTACYTTADMMVEIGNTSKTVE